MAELLPRGMRWCLLSNYQISLGSQVLAAPALLEDGVRLVIVHGHPPESKRCRKAASRLFLRQKHPSLR